MSSNQIIAVKVSPLPTNMKEQWDNAYAQLKAVVENLSYNVAKPFVRKFAAAAVRDRCSDQQLMIAWSLTRRSGLGDVFVVARADAEDATNVRNGLMIIGNSE